MPLPLDTPRADAWWADLTEAQSAAIYDLWRSTGKWYVAADYARKECGVQRDISQSAFDRFTHWLRKQRFNQRLVSARAAAVEAETMARKAHISDEAIIKTFQTLGAEAYLATGKTDEARKLVDMATKTAGVALERQRLELAKSAQRTKDDQLRLAREKFEAAERRENAAKAALGDAKLTDEAKIAKMKEIFG